MSPSFIFAQGSSNLLTLSIYPENPKPNETVTASIKTLGVNLDLSKISWSINGKVVDSSIGKKAFTFNAPNSGETILLKVNVESQNNLNLEKSLTISSAGDIDLIWEVTNGYTPLFYRGKTLPIQESGIKVTAIPNVKSGSSVAQPDDFVYNWRKDNKVALGQSGFAKNSITFSNQLLDTQNKIDVSASNGIKTVSDSITITPFQPEIIFYEYDNLSGMGQYQRALGSVINLTNPRLQIIAEPYFLSKSFKSNPKITMEWKLGGSPASTPIKNILGISASEKGVFPINLKYEDTQKLFGEFKAKIDLNVQ